MSHTLNGQPMQTRVDASAWLPHSTALRDGCVRARPHRTAGSIRRRFRAAAPTAFTFLFVAMSPDASAQAFDDKACPADRGSPATVNFRVDNDLFGGQDQGYSNGAQLTLVSPNLKRYHRKIRQRRAGQHLAPPCVRDDGRSLGAARHHARRQHVEAQPQRRQEAAGGLRRLRLRGDARSMEVRAGALSQQPAVRRPAGTPGIRPLHDQLLVFAEVHAVRIERREAAPQPILRMGIHSSHDSGVTCASKPSNANRVR
ncbi:MAG: hypothetical protein QM766_20335 [Burkholderiaceae bacterium]